MITYHTPVEKYVVNGYDIFVKREDLSAQPPLPPFAKVRGLYEVMLSLQKGFDIVGYTETSISMAGWGVAVMAEELGMKAVIYSPQYKKPLPILEYHQSKWIEHGAILEPIKAGMAKVNYNICKKLLKEKYPNSVMLPLGLPFPETVEEVCKEALRSNLQRYETIVTCVGSGTMCAGLLKALKYSRETTNLYGVLTRSGNIRSKRHKIIRTAGRYLWERNIDNFNLIDANYQYTDREDWECPFPCHAYYDRKAWRWLIENIETLRKPILFWNIGA